MHAHLPSEIYHDIFKKQYQEDAVLVIVGTKNILLKQTHKALSGYQAGIVPNGGNGNGVYVESEDSDKENLEIDESELERDEFTGYTVGKYGQKSSKADVELATIQKVASQIRRGILTPDAYDLVIVDEVHNAGTQQKVDAIKRFGRVAGFTATPYRYSGILKDPSQYGFEVIASYTLPEAQEEELLPPLYGLQLNTSELVDDIPTTQTGKIDFKALEKILKNNPELRPYIVDHLVPLITMDGNHYKTVVAVNFVWEAQEIARLLKDKGIKVGVAVNQQAAKQIDSPEIPAIDSIERYSLPEDDPKSIQVLISPYVASEGFDAPWTEFLVWASPTDSPLRYTQYTGRLGRRNNGKAYGVVIDCLYQTSQFGWTYNFGMWMKGHVRELDNGMLYLGPMRLMPNMSAIQRMQALTPHHNLENLQRGELLPVQETDFAITYKNVGSVFYGHTTKKGRLAQQIFENILETNPGATATRKIGTGIVKVVTDRELFIKAMLEKGAKLKLTEIQELQENDFPITQASLRPLFRGGSSEVARLAKTVLEEFSLENPSLTLKRRSGSRIIDVVLNKDIFIKKMIKKGALLKNDPTNIIQETDFVMGARNLMDVFVGSPKTLRPIAAKVIEYLAAQDSNFLTTKNNRTVQVLTNRDKFIQEMLKAGAKLKKK